MKNHFSKSKYCRLWQCPKMLWMDKYKPEEKAEDATDDSRMEAGTEVGKRIIWKAGRGNRDC